ncbi:MAG: hypothetical protein GYB68_14575 [Chloroflexi bacterium]|nr:hypothetical protein [Chloroflexota bacterium]
MVFKGTWRAVLAERQTTTRRWVKQNDELKEDPRRVLRYSNKKKEQIVKYQVDKTYSVRPHPTADAVGYIIINDIQRGIIGDMTDLDAYHEGFDSLAAFKENWINVYSEWDPQQAVWVIHFELI